MRSGIVIYIGAVLVAILLGVALIALLGVSIDDALDAFQDGTIGSAYAIGASVNRSVVFGLVGTGFVLGQERPGAGHALVFVERAGLVPVQLLLEGGVVVGAELTAPEPFSLGGTVDPADACACLSLDLHDLALDRHPPVIASTGLPFLVVELASRDALRRARADSAAFARVLPPHGVDGVYLYTRGLEPGEAGTDMQARMFAPLDGIPEDPATGSATCAMVGLQAALLAEPDAEVSLLVGQGFDMGRPSLLRARAVRRGGQVEQVQVGGHCIAVMQGSFELAGAG